MSQTDARALELVVLDFDTRGKPTDEEIAKMWGLADARSVRAVRESEAYHMVKREFTEYAISYAGEMVGEIVQRAGEGLRNNLPLYVQRIVDLLTPPPNVVEWRISASNFKAATAGLQFLAKLASLESTRSDESQDREVRVRMPSMVTAQSQIETVKQFREREVTITVRETRDDDAIDVDYSVG